MCGTGTCDICFRRNFYKSQSEVQSLYRKWHTSFKLKYKIKKKKTSDIFKEKNIKFCLYVDGKLSEVSYTTRHFWSLYIALNRECKAGHICTGFQSFFQIRLALLGRACVGQYIQQHQ